MNASSQKPIVLLVETDERRAAGLAAALSKRFECRRTCCIQEVVDQLSAAPRGAVVANYALDEHGSGLEVLQMVREIRPRAFRLVYSANATPGFRRGAERAAQVHLAADSGAPDFVAVLERTLAELLEPPSLEIPTDLKTIRTDVWTARAPTTRRFLAALREAAERDVPVYISGEPGSGVTRAGVTLRQWRREWKARGAPAGPRPDPSVPTLWLPALRERPQDLPVLAARCLLEHAVQSGEPVRRMAPAALEDLLQREWYGNVIELAAVMLRALHRAGTRPVIEAADLPQDRQPAWRPSQHSKDQGQRDCLLRQLRAARNVSAAARLEGCSRANYIRLMRRLGVIRADILADPLLEDAETVSQVV